MEDGMEVWGGAVIAGVVGFALGALVMWWTDRKRSGGSSVATLKKEHEQFRDQVTDHFVETAERINRLTDSYKDLFDHLSQGAETLVDESSLRERMPRVSDQEVRLKRLGTRTAATDRKEGEKSVNEAASESSPTAPARPSRAASDRAAATESPKPSSAGASASATSGGTGADSSMKSSSKESSSDPASSSNASSSSSPSASGSSKPGDSSSEKTGGSEKPGTESESDASKPSSKKPAAGRSGDTAEAGKPDDSGASGKSPKP
jgi:uncharacterized membrane-anchored protein YhcB (DUF1043 family)